MGENRERKTKKKKKRKKQRIKKQKQHFNTKIIRRPYMLYV